MVLCRPGAALRSIGLRMPRTWIVPVLVLAAFPAAAQGPSRPTSFLETDCRYLTSYDSEDVPHSAPPGKLWLPDGDLFRPLMADLKQPRGYLSFRSVDFQSTALPAGGQDRTIKAAVVGLGSELGIWRRSQRSRCEGVQVNLLAAAFSQFNLDAPGDDLINTDFLVGPELMFRRGAVSARLRLYHQSSHLGDEFLLDNPEVTG